MSSQSVAQAGISALSRFMAGKNKAIQGGVNNPLA
jgi:hypothetical protein